MKIKLILIFAIAIFTSCSNEDPEECVSFDFVPATAVYAPVTGKVNETIEIKVDFIVYNGCGKFERFVEEGSERSKIVDILAKYEGCICTQDIPTRTAVYRFTPSAPGRYEIRFQSGEPDSITVNLEITE